MLNESAKHSFVTHTMVCNGLCYLFEACEYTLSSVAVNVVTVVTKAESLFRINMIACLDL